MVKAKAEGQGAKGARDKGGGVKEKGKGWEGGEGRERERAGREGGQG